MHGAYDQGALPSLALYQTRSSNQLGALFVHEGYRADWNDTEVCGEPVVMPGVVLGMTS